MKEKNLYKRFKQDFINYVASFSIWNLETIFEEPFCFLYLKLKNEWFNEFGVSKHNEAFFYNNNIYKKIKYILNSELEQIENRNEVDENLYHINDQKFFCIPKVTVIITIYNSEKYLSDSLNSIINQTLKEIEIICINDGSTDNSLKILNYYKKKDNRIIIFNQKNKGVNSARNLGLKNAKGEFILFFDSDDLLITEALEKLYNLGKYKNLDIIFFNLKFIFENNITEIHFPNIFHKINSFKLIKSGKDIFLNMIKENKFILSPCLQFINHKFLLKNKIKFLKQIKYDDIIFFYNLILKINRTFETDEIFYLKKINEKFNKKTDKLIKKLNDYIISIKELFNQSITIYNKNNIINQSLELFIDSIEELIFFVFNKIQKNKLFLINQFHQNEKILLLFILLNKKIDTNFIQNIIKKNNNHFYHYTFLFINFEKNYCFKLKYKINKIKKILNFKF
jgi:glycosyltransferase involved in cell wall biosynthesis